MADDLILANLDVARSVARKHKLRLGGDYEQLEADAYAALVQLANEFRPELGTDFRIHCHRFLPGRLIDLDSAWHRWREHCATAEFLDTFPDRRPSSLDALESAEAVEALLDRLDPRSAHLLRRTLIDGVSQEVARAEIGIRDCSYASRLRKRALAKLRDVAEPPQGLQSRDD